MKAVGGRARLWALGVAVLVGALLGAIVAAAALPGTDLALGVRAGFLPLCHQLAERSFALGGEPLSVCHRCFGIYAGLAAGALAVVAGARAHPKSLVGWALALVPLIAHVGLLQLVPAIDRVALRVGTGLLLGGWMGAVLPWALASVDFSASVSNEAGALVRRE